MYVNPHAYYTDPNERKVALYLDWLDRTGRTAYVFPKANARTLRQRARAELEKAGIPVVEVDLAEYEVDKEAIIKEAHFADPHFCEVWRRKS